MVERISWKGDKGKYQPRIRSDRIKDLYRVKEFTSKPMTVLVDEALSLYLATFFTSPLYQRFAENLDRELEYQDNALEEDPNLDDYEDLSNYFDRA